MSAIPVTGAAGTDGSRLASRRADHSKRAMDLVVSLVILALAFPLLVLVWLAVVSTSRGPGLFRQPRVGRNGTEFVMYKFRTMRVGATDDDHRAYVRALLAGEAETIGGLYKLDEARTTAVGALLRRLSLDELPQLFNVVKGDMSLVGPRPALLWEAELFPDWSATRFQVPPGITGLWQVSGRSRLTMLQGLKLDVAYVQQRSVGLDLRILAKTIPALLRGGAR